MSNPHKPFRVHLQFAGNAYDLRIQAHETDDTQLVVKSSNPEALDNLLLATGVDPGVKARIKGQAHHIAFVSKDGCAKLLAAAILNLATKPEAAAAQSASFSSDDDGDDSDD